MKKLIFSIALAAFVVSLSNAQDEIFFAKLKEQQVPAEEVTAITQNLEDGLTVTDYYAIPAKILDKEWVVTFNPEHKNLTDKKYTNYDVNFSGRNISGEGVYDADGNLISFTETMKDTALPHTIQKNIYKEFPGWVTASDHETVHINRNDQETIHYKVALTKGNEKKYTIYDGNGDLVKIGRKHKMLFNRSSCECNMDS